MASHAGTASDGRGKSETCSSVQLGEKLRFRGIWVQMQSCAQVDQSRRICEAVAGGELDVAIIGGEVEPELAPALRAITYAEDQLVRAP